MVAGYTLIVSNERRNPSSFATRTPRRLAWLVVAAFVSLPGVVGFACGGEVQGVEGQDGEDGPRSGGLDGTVDGPTSGSVLVTLATGQGTSGGGNPNVSFTSGLVVDDQSVYWTSTALPPPLGLGNGEILKVGLNGGVPVTLASGLGEPSSLALHGSEVYFADNAQNDVGFVGINGGAPTILKTGVGMPFAIAVDWPHLVLTSWYGVAELNAVDAADYIFRMDPTYSANLLAVSHGVVYWTDDSSVRKWELASETISVAASDQDFPLGIAVDATYLYWANGGILVDDGGFVPTPRTGSIVKMALAGGAPMTLASDLMSPNYVAIDETNIYWTDSVSSVMKMSLEGGKVTTLAANQAAPLAIVVDSTSVYWTNGGLDPTCDASNFSTGSVVKLTPK
jgi:hypothetical protein